MKKRFFCIDGHTCGNPVRLLAGGAPHLTAPGIAGKRLEFIRNYDWIRTGLMFEPRGHAQMSGSILYQAENPENDVAVLFIETSGCLPMCGHGLIGTITFAIEEGLVQPRTPGTVKVETPAGLVIAQYKLSGQKVSSVSFTNVPSFLFRENLQLNIPTLGDISVDIAYGGNFYAIIDPQEGYADLEQVSIKQLLIWSPLVRDAVNKAAHCIHPVDNQIAGVSHVMWTGNALRDGSTSRNAVFYGENAIDRSPCGTGTSARMAQWHSKGMLKEGDEFIHESIIGSRFKGTVRSTCKIAEFDGIIPQIEGWARVTGYNNLVIDDVDDPYALGFQVI
jgi:4-hydroxyproline epimerase